jgi:hypothetical protein
MIYKTKRFFSVLCFTFLFSALLPAQEPPKDLIVLVDTSASMSSFYANVTNYLTGPFLNEHLNLGDTFHLISFSGKPRFEIARRVIDLGDVQTINGRIFLLYPLEPLSDISSAISYGEKYTTILPQGRQKQIFIVSDSEEKDVDGLVKAAAARLQNGTTIYYLKVPFSAAARIPPQNRQPANAQNPPETSGQASAAPVRAGAPGASGSAASSGSPASGSGAANSSEPAGSAGSSGSGSSSVGSSGSGSSGSGSSGSGSSGSGSSGSPSPADSNVAALPDPSRDPAGTESSAGAAPPAVLPEPEEQPGLPGAVSVTDSGGDSAALTDSGEIRDSPADPVRQNTRPENRSGESFSIASLPLPLLIALGILLLLILGFVIIIMLRNLTSSPNRVMASATTIDNSPADRNGAAARDAALLNSFASTAKAASRSVPPRRYHRDDQQNQSLSNPSMLSLFVEDQNTAIGRRNVHTLKAGSRFTIGGGNSDFLIFLVPIPPQIGELRFDGTNCTFVPLKTKYFPDIGSQQVPECIGKTIRVLSDKNYELFFHFERYKDPLLVLNQLLHSISVPEK